MQYDRKISKAGTQSQLNMDNNKISDNKKINKRYRKFCISKEDQFRTLGRPFHAQQFSYNFPS